jgi:outer membrane protein assembly factor BamB
LRDDDGSEVWRVKIKGESNALPLIRNDAVTVLTIDGQLRNFSIFDGSERWTTNQDMPLLTLRGASSPIAIGNNVIAGFDNGRLVSVNIDTGVVEWESMLSPPSGRTDLERLTDIDGVIKSMGQDIYAVGYQSQVASIAAESGQILWAKDLSSTAGVAIDEELIYAVTDTGDLVGMKRLDGSEIWRKDILLRREVTAPTKFKSTIVVGDYEGYLHFFDHKTGELVSRKRVGKGAISGSPVVIGEYLYVQSESSEMAVFSIPIEDKSNLSDTPINGGT